MALINKLTAIADAIRGKTGKTEEMTLDQMAVAIDGIKAVGGLAYDMGEFVLDTDNQFAQTRLVPHGLGAKPDFVMVWTDDLVGVTNQDSTNATWAGFIWLNQWMGLENWGTSVTKFPGTTIGFQQSKASDNMQIVKPNSQAYTLSEGDISESYFSLCYYRNVFYRAGLTYRYFVAKAWWNVGGVPNAE